MRCTEAAQLVRNTMLIGSRKSCGKFNECKSTLSIIDQIFIYHTCLDQYCDRFQDNELSLLYSTFLVQWRIWGGGKGTSTPSAHFFSFSATFFETFSGAPPILMDFGGDIAKIKRWCFPTLCIWRPLSWKSWIRH